MMHEAIGLDPEFARAHATLGRCYVLHAQGWGGRENYALAERSLKRALELDPTIVNAHLQMVYVDLHHGDKDHARATIDRLLREAPDDPSVLFVAGMLFRLDGLYDKALEMYDRLLSLNPRDVPIVSFNKARIYTHEGRFDEAIAELQKGQAAEPEHPLIKTFLAVALFNRGDVDEAQALIEEVLRQNPHFDGVQPLLAWCYSARGEHERARALITDRVQGGGHRRPRHRLLGGLVLRDGGDEGGGAGVGAPGRLDRQRELPALREEPQARQPARRSPLRGAHGRPEAPLGGPPGGSARGGALAVLVHLCIPLRRLTSPSEPPHPKPVRARTATRSGGL